MLRRIPIVDKLKLMIRAYDELVDFLAAGTTRQRVAEFELSEQSKIRVADLIQREKTSGLSKEETSELDHFLRVEHVMRLAKAKARAFCTDD